MKFTVKMRDSNDVIREIAYRKATVEMTEDPEDLCIVITSALEEIIRSGVLYIGFENHFITFFGMPVTVVKSEELWFSIGTFIKVEMEEGKE